MSQLMSIERFAETAGNYPNVFVLQIGANDGKSFDPVHPHIENNGWRGLLVEPLPDFHGKLQKTYEGAIKEGRIKTAQCAITEENGTVEMTRLPADFTGLDGTSWTQGIATIDNTRGVMSVDKVKAESVSEQVPSKSLGSLIRENDVKHVDVLQIDTEGYDYRVLKQWDFEKFGFPSVIHLEHQHLKPNELSALKALFEEKGYYFSVNQHDTFAVKPEILKAMVTEEELQPYQKYVKNGSIQNEGDLSYILALLVQATRHYVGMEPKGFEVPISRWSTKNYDGYIDGNGDDIGAQPDYFEAQDAVNRMRPFFNSDEVLERFLSNELPRDAIVAWEQNQLSPSEAPRSEKIWIGKHWPPASLVRDGPK